MIINCTVTSNIRVNFLMLLLFGGYFPIGEKKLLFVKFENALGNGSEKYSLGRLTFSVGEGFVGSVA